MIARLAFLAFALTSVSLVACASSDRPEDEGSSSAAQTLPDCEEEGEEDCTTAEERAAAVAADQEEEDAEDHALPPNPSLEGPCNSKMNNCLRNQPGRYPQSMCYEGYRACMKGGNQWP